MLLGGYPRITVKKQTSINGCDGSTGSVRALAASAGTQFEGVQAEVYRLRDKLGPDRKKGYDETIRRLARGGALSEAEERALLQLGARFRRRLRRRVREVSPLRAGLASADVA